MSSNVDLISPSEFLANSSYDALSEYFSSSEPPSNPIVTITSESISVNCKSPFNATSTVMSPKNPSSSVLDELSETVAQVAPVENIPSMKANNANPKA